MVAGEGCEDPTCLLGSDDKIRNSEPPFQGVLSTTPPFGTRHCASFCLFLCGRKPNTVNDIERNPALSNGQFGIAFVSHLSLK